MIRIAGGDPLTSGTDGVYQIEAEQILDFDPEVILLGDAAYGVTPEQVAARPGWDALTAVKNGDVRPIDDVIVTRPGPRLAEGIRALALAIHPDLVAAVGDAGDDRDRRPRSRRRPPGGSRPRSGPGGSGRAGWLGGGGGGRRWSSCSSAGIVLGSVDLAPVDDGRDPREAAPRARPRR